MTKRHQYDDDRRIRTISPSLGTPITEVAVVGTTLEILLIAVAPEEAHSFTLRTSHPFHIQARYTDESNKRDVDVEFGKAVMFDITRCPRIFIDALRDAPRHITVSLAFEPSEFNPRSSTTAVLRLGIISISLDVDADRDGVIEKDSNLKNSWKWGYLNDGAIVITDFGHYSTRRKHPDYPPGTTYAEMSVRKIQEARRQRKYMTKCLIRSRGPRPSGGWSLHLAFPDKESQRCVYIYRKNPLQEENERLLGPGIIKMETVDIKFPQRSEIPLWLKGLPRTMGEGHGVFSIDMILKYHGIAAYKDSIQLRASPFIIPSSTEAAVNIFIDTGPGNTQLINTLSRIAEGKTDLNVVQYSDEMNDSLQGHMLFGYTQTPTQTLPVVFVTSAELLKYSTIIQNNLTEDTQICHCHDACNTMHPLVAMPSTPPRYPLGCILIKEDEINCGVWFRKLLRRQKVQPIIQIPLDWMKKPSMTSIINFVQSPRENHEKGFKVIISSTKQAFTILKHLQDSGRGDTRIFEGIKSVDFDHFIDDIKRILVEKMDLKPNDFLEVPMMWMRSEINPKKAVPYFPNPVNMIILDKHAVVPRLFGPVVKGMDMFEDFVQEQLHSQTVVRLVHFVDVWNTEIHDIDSTVTVQRHTPLPYKWWNMNVKEPYQKV
uniref:Protein-arginine deiminase type-1-like n=1 Tax=Saccoglossus kowalevskii TaxID=10224 RepID=A0ABM0MG44_SACKO|nr:PREDICTED: protein-arginine deiminase type-1-like [Saccoglossus kowalevskii]